MIDWPKEEDALRKHLRDAESMLVGLREWVAWVYTQDVQWGRWLDASLGLLVQRLGWYAAGEEQVYQTAGWKQWMYQWKNYRKLKRGKEDRLPSVIRQLFFATEVSHLKQWLPILKSFADPQTVLTVTSRPKVHAAVQSAGFPCAMIPYPPKGKTIKLPSAYREKLSAVVSLQHVVTHALQDAIPQFWVLEKQLASWVKQQPNLCLGVGNCLTQEGRFLVSLAKINNLKTWSVQHGAIGPNVLYKTLNVDQFFVYGQREKDYLEQMGVDVSVDIAVSGAPYLDQGAAEVPATQRLQEVLGLAAGEMPVVVMLSGYGHMTSKGHFFQILDALFDWLQQHPQRPIVFKLHRKDKAAHYQGYLKEKGHDRVWVIEYNDSRFPSDVFYWLSQAKLLVTGNSTVAKEAMLIQLPVVTIDLQNEYSDTDFIRQKASLHIQKAEDLRSSMEDLLGDVAAQADLVKGQNEFIRGYFANVTQRDASRQIVNSLEACG